MKKDYTLYVISMIAKGRRTYLAEDLSKFTDQFDKARFFGNKEEATLWLRSAITYNTITNSYAPRKSQPAYELLSVDMKISKEACSV